MKPRIGKTECGFVKKSPKKGGEVTSNITISDPDAGNNKSQDQAYSIIGRALAKSRC